MSSLPAGALLLDALESGELRVAERDASGEWVVNADIKQAILDIFKNSEVVSMGNELRRESYAALEVQAPPFRDKDLLRVRRFTKRDGVRLVPGGSAVRRGAYLGPGVVCMPPMYVNIGAYVGANSMIDSHALVGSCAQVGEGVHVSAAAQVGGVLEPSGARPVIIEEGAFIGGNTGLYEGVLVRREAVIAAGVILTATTRVYDLVNEEELTGTRERPLEIPAGAVVIPGTRPAAGDWARERGLSMDCAIIPKYRDQQTDVATSLEEALRE
jgi:2,3,4,5-tetrahydropyridine-2-carboxylate N-succinyltransferase